MSKEHKTRTPAQIAAVEKMRAAKAAKQTNEPTVKESPSLENPGGRGFDTRTNEGAQVQPPTPIDTPSRAPRLPDAAIAVIVAAKHFGKGDAMSSLPTSISQDGVSWHAELNGDGSVTLYKEGNRHVYDSNRAMLSGAKDILASANRRWTAASDMLENNRNATGDMLDKLIASELRFRGERDHAQSVVDECYANCPAIVGERLRTESEGLTREADGHDKKAEALRKSAALWRAKGPDLQENPDPDAPQIDRNEQKAQECDRQADGLEYKSRTLRNDVANKLAEADRHPGIEGQAVRRLVPGELLGLSV